MILDAREKWISARSDKIDIYASERLVFDNLQKS